jgi:hypothetical protein
MDKEEEEARIAARDLHPGSTVSASSPSKLIQTEIATPASYEREGLRRLPFGERRYNRNCGSDSAPVWESEHEDDNDHEDDGDMVYNLDPVNFLGEEYLCSFSMLQVKVNSRFAELERVNKNKFQNERHNAKVDLHNAFVHVHTLQKQVDNLVSENQKLKATVKELTTGLESEREERTAAATVHVVTPPTTPTKEITIRPTSPRAPTRVVTQLP